MIPNLFWTVVFLMPITVFCYTFITPKTISILIGVSFIPIFFPNSFFDKIQLSRKADWYKKIGVRYINTVTQNGSMINKILKRKYPDFKVVSKRANSIRRRYNQTYFFEKFHFSLFVFFIMVTINAGVQKQFYWVFTLTICNLFYNVYPALLQQYIRVKLRFHVTANKSIRS